ncbi:MAG: hypothetical protein AB1941_06025 [Gemmatimonadota bacterium]
MKKQIASETTPQRRDQSTSGKGPERVLRLAVRRTGSESVEQAIARVRSMPSLLDELGPEAVASIQRTAADHPEVLGRTSSAKRRAAR